MENKIASTKLTITKHIVLAIDDHLETKEKAYISTEFGSKMGEIFSRVAASRKGVKWFEQSAKEKTAS